MLADFPTRRKLTDRTKATIPFISLGPTSTRSPLLIKYRFGVARRRDQSPAAGINAALPLRNIVTLQLQPNRERSQL